MDWKEQLRGYFFAPNPKDMNIEAAMLLKHKHIPRALYKYRCVTEYSLSNLASDTLWCGNASQFSDPYDTALSFNFDDNFLRSLMVQSLRQQKNDLNGLLGEGDIDAIETATDPMKQLISQIASVYPTLSDDMQGALYDAIGKAWQNQMGEMVRSFSAIMQDGYKICSLSERCDSLPMWAHYTGNHSGFVAEYDFSKLAPDDVRARSLWPVIYSEALFDASAYIAESISGDFNNLFGIIAALHKSSDWSYENEWRIILPLGPGSAPLNYSVPTPVRILLGARISQGDEVKVRSIAEEKAIEVRKMEIDPNQFKMLAKPTINPEDPWAKVAET